MKKYNLDKIDQKVLSKYGNNAFMYVEYPHKKNWNNKYNYNEVTEIIKDNLKKKINEKYLFYVHIPHCHTQCLYCTCHVEITKDYNVVKKYLDYLYKEIDMYQEMFDEISLSPKISEVHLGGGSPTYPKIEDFNILIEKLKKFIQIDKLDEFSIEIDPRRVKEDKMIYYHSKGINRISFGVQEFDKEVQKHVARVQPRSLTERLLTPKIRELFPNGINFDIICGLPGQKIESFNKTVETIIDLNPDRICLNYMHMSPKFHPHQNKMPKDIIPDQFLRKELFFMASEMLEKNGFARAGYDHFVKKDDYIYNEMKKEKMAWNRLGIASGKYNNVIGVGVSTTCKLDGKLYYQNFYDKNEYEKAIDSGKLPISTHHSMSSEDRMREELIQTIRTYFHLDKEKFSNKYQINFDEYFRKDLKKIQEYQENHLLTMDEKNIELSEVGKQFSNLVASTFDEYNLPG